VKEAGLLLFGGTFDPIHNGHLIVCRAVAELLGVQRAVLIPSAQPPHKVGKRVSSATDRLAMTGLAVQGDCTFAVSDCELKREGPSYTLDTVNEVRTAYGPTVPLYWLIGGDSLGELASWHRIAELADACTLVTAARPGWEGLDAASLKGVLGSAQIKRIDRHIFETPAIAISATDIRRRVRAGLSIRYLVPETIRQYIDDHGLYTTPDTGL